jgi:hypothetical protein
MSSSQVAADIGNGVSVTIEASRLAAELGFSEEELHSKLRHCFGVYERGIGQEDGCLTYRCGARSWTVAVAPDGAIGGAPAPVAAPTGPRGWLVSLSWRAPGDVHARLP